MKRFAISILAGFVSGIIGLKLVSSVYQSIVHPGIQSTDGFLDIGAAALAGFVFFEIVKMQMATPRLSRMAIINCGRNSVIIIMEF